jgi:hypothetical protein
MTDEADLSEEDALCRLSQPVEAIDITGRDEDEDRRVEHERKCVLVRRVACHVNNASAETLKLVVLRTRRHRLRGRAAAHQQEA